MSGFLVRTKVAAGHDRNVNEPQDPPVEAFAKKGMTRTHTIAGDGFVLDLFANSSHDPTRILASDVNGWFCTYVGTLIYRGLAGSAATSAILKDAANGGIECIDAAIGNYCVLIKDESGLHIVTDRAGLHHVYHSDDVSLISNSFIAAACALPRTTLQTQEILEYVLLGATFGTKTLLQEIQLLDSEHEILVQGASAKCHSRNSVWSTGADVWQSLALPQRISQAIEVADDYYGQIAKTYGGKVTAALSGGYDSRLSLALLRRHQIAPKLFVYGSDNDLDVRIAKMICRNEQLELSHLDRAIRSPMEPAAYWQNQEDVFHGLDGLTQYGFACEPFEVSHRRERVSGGLIAVNGGGGEIWRDFWKLPDRPMTAEAFVQGYFSGRFDGLAGVDNSLRPFFGRLAEKIGELVGTSSGQMSSAIVQSLYARLRLRFWQGKNNSVDNFIGYAVTPFSEHQFAVPAMWIPLDAKRHGWFEREIIRRTSPDLARYPSSHGYRLEDGPNFVQRSKANITRLLPTWVRMRHRRQALRRGRRYYQSERFVHARFGTGSLEVEQHVHMAQLGDSLAFSRALTVERMLRGQWL